MVRLGHQREQVGWRLRATPSECITIWLTTGLGRSRNSRSLTRRVTAWTCPGMRRRGSMPRHGASGGPHSDHVRGHVSGAGLDRCVGRTAIAYSTMAPRCALPSPIERGPGRAKPAINRDRRASGRGGVPSSGSGGTPARRGSARMRAGPCRVRCEGRRPWTGQSDAGVGRAIGCTCAAPTCCPACRSCPGATGR